VVPYWILFSVFAAGALRIGSQNAHRSLSLVVMAVATAVFIGFRYKTGGDWANYRLIFEFLAYRDLGFALSYGDPGYSVLNWLAAQLGVGIWFVNFICAAIFMWGVIKFARSQPNPWLVCLLAIPYLIVVVGIGYTRQAVAIAVAMAAVAEFSRGRTVKFVLFIALATLFHKSAFLFLPLMGLAYTHNRLQTFLLGGTIGATLYYLFISSEMARLTQVYTQTGLESEGASIRVAMSLVPALLFLMFPRRFGFAEHERILWRNLSLGALAAAVALALAPALSTLIDRLSLYLIPLQLAVLSRLPLMFSTRRTGGIEIIILLIAYSAVVQYVWLNFATHARLWIPYQVYPIGSV
jgi:hypothetical protein